MNISIIIPTYNRPDLLRLCLTSLLNQNCRNFEAIVVDDWSSEDIMWVVKEFENVLEIKYFWQKDLWFRAGEARNFGARISNTDNFLFLDSHIVLNKFAVAHYINYAKANPDLTILGRYDWLAPMRIGYADLFIHWDQIINNELPKTKIEWEIGYIGKDPRTLKIETVIEKWGTDCFSGNLFIPRKQFEEIGGFDIAIQWHGGEDPELGMRLEKAGYKALFSENVIGYHIYHKRNQEENIKSLEKNVAYIAEKHGKDFKELLDILSRRKQYT